MRSSLWRILAPLCVVALLAGWYGPDDASARRRADQESLKVFGKLVGEWKGTGLPQRGSTRGSWVEKGDWAWKLSKEHAALELKLEKGKYLKSGVLSARPDQGAFAFEAVLADGSKRQFRGKVGARDTLVMIADPTAAEGLRRITLTPLHDTRFLMLLEAQGADGAAFARLGEVGYTRQGVAFAAGESYPVCIVTEGRGTIQVKHKGQTYWVCCSGCKDLFDENPEAILAEAAERQREKNKGK